MSVFLERKCKHYTGVCCWGIMRKQIVVCEQASFCTLLSTVENKSVWDLQNQYMAAV